jgi:hypothetical protein
MKNKKIFRFTREEIEHLRGFLTDLDHVMEMLGAEIEVEEETLDDDDATWNTPFF